jgi:hypothetical protein
MKQKNKKVRATHLNEVLRTKKNAKHEAKVGKKAKRAKRKQDEQRILGELT